MGIPDLCWRLTDCNSTYELCPTYPQHLAVPSAVDDALIEASAKFRSQKRFPTLSWRSPETNCSICRCSQPLVGIGSRRSSEDERLIYEINRCSGLPLAIYSNPGTPPARPYVIADARPVINATANQAAGKGYESEKAYENCYIVFMGIANIHAMRKSYDLMLDACSDDNGATWFRNVDLAGWLAHVQKVLKSVGRIVRYLTIDGMSVLVHCSDGWDRTSQLTSLSMLLVDPYYRTLSGFIVLIEKEWLSFGHKFGDRLGWTNAGWKDDERSPIFAQFLDCVYQCIHQNPNRFEFNEDLLLFLMEHISSGLFGNFFANCEKERRKAQDSSLSIWMFVDSNRTRFINPFFCDCRSVWVPTATPLRIVVWEKWFLRWHDVMWSVTWSESNETKGQLINNSTSTAIAASSSMIIADACADDDSSKRTGVTWVNDSEVSTCQNCQRAFTMYRRKHHCRMCGRIFCEACTSDKRIIPSSGHTRPQRCCAECAKSIDEAMKPDGFLDDDEAGIVEDAVKSAVEAVPSKETERSRSSSSESSESSATSLSLLNVDADRFSTAQTTTGRRGGIRMKDFERNADRLSMTPSRASLSIKEHL